MLRLEGGLVWDHLKYLTNQTPLFALLSNQTPLFTWILEMSVSPLSLSPGPPRVPRMVRKSVMAEVQHTSSRAPNIRSRLAFTGLCLSQAACSFRIFSRNWNLDLEICQFLKNR